MNATGYKILGYAVWHGGKWYLRRTYARKVRSAFRASAVAGGLLLAAGLAVWLLKRG